jgi:hypothetical protein
MKIYTVLMPFSVCPPSTTEYNVSCFKNCLFVILAVFGSAVDGPSLWFDILSVQRKAQAMMR